MLIVFCYVRDIELVARLLEDKGASDLPAIALPGRSASTRTYPSLP